MNKRVILAIVVVVVIAAAVILGIVLGGKKPAAKTKTIEIVDEKLGYKTVFTYPEEEDYTVTDTDTDSGRSVEVEFESNALNLEAEVYYSMVTRSTFDSLKDSRSSYKYYQTYTFNGYDAYCYSDYEDSTYLIIMLDDEKGESLFVSLEKEDYKAEGTIMDILNSESMQNFLNSITFEVTK